MKQCFNACYKQYNKYENKNYNIKTQITLAIIFYMISHFSKEMISPQEESLYLMAAYPQMSRLVSHRNMSSIHKDLWLSIHGTQDLADWQIIQFFSFHSNS